ICAIRGRIASRVATDSFAPALAQKTLLSAVIKVHQWSVFTEMLAPSRFSLSAAAVLALCSLALAPMRAAEPAKDLIAVPAPKRIVVPKLSGGKSITIDGDLSEPQ